MGLILNVGLPPLGAAGDVLTVGSGGSTVIWAAGGGGGGGASWGSITGTLSSQTDLQSALNAKVSTSVTVNGHALSSNVTVTASDLSLATVASTGAYSDLTGTPTLGTAAALDVGVGANNVVQLDGSSKLPAVDGSQLTNLPGGGGSPPFTLMANDVLAQADTGGCSIGLDANNQIIIEVPAGNGSFGFNTSSYPQMLSSGGGGTNGFGFDSGGNPQVVGDLYISGQYHGDGSLLTGISASPPFIVNQASQLALNSNGENAFGLSGLGLYGYPYMQVPNAEGGASYQFNEFADPEIFDSVSKLFDIDSDGNAHMYRGFVAPSLHAANGVTASGPLDTFAITDGICTAASLSGVSSGAVASIFEKAETGSDANILTYAVGGTDQLLNILVAVDVSAITGTSVVVTLSWNDSNNAAQTKTVTLTTVSDGTISVPINVKALSSVVVSSVFVGVSTAYNISAVVYRLV